MNNIFEFLSGFFSVETIIGLISAIVAGIIFLFFKNRKLTQIKGVVNELKTKRQADTAIRLAEDLGFDLDRLLGDSIKKEKNKIEIIKEAMRNKQNKFKMQIGLIWGGIVFITLIIASLILSNYIIERNTDNAQTKTTIPVFTNDSLTINTDAKQVVNNEIEVNEEFLSIWKNNQTETKFNNNVKILLENSDSIILETFNNSCKNENWIVENKKNALSNICVFLKDRFDIDSAKILFLNGVVNDLSIEKENKKILLNFKIKFYEK